MTTSPGYGYTHDATGNRLSKGSAWVYTWDALNRMLTHARSGQPTATYAYRADGMRVGKTYGTATTLYRHDGQMPVQEVESASGTVTAVTDSALGARGVDAISRTTSSGTVVRYPLYNAHGSMVGTVASTGPTSLGDRRSYDAWRGVRAGATTGTPSGRYVANLGHTQDDESGLVYMRARYYEPTSGRFLSEDPAVDGANWYIYCSNNPIDRIDKDGKDDGYTMAMTLLSASLILLGMALLGVALDRWTVVATKLEGLWALKAIAEATADKEKRILVDLIEDAKDQVSEAGKSSKGGKGGSGGAVSALIGLSLIYRDLLLDIDLGPEGGGGLDFLYG
ncbi:MAG: RHS repeat-associated core domain-containing protein [Fimbriimonas sp.]